MEGGAALSNSLKLAALRWSYASVHAQKIQIPWDTNLPQYGKLHFAYAKGTRREITDYTERNCPHRFKWAIERWMKGENPTEIKVGIDCSGYVYRVLDEACQISGKPGLQRTLGTTCDYTALDTLTPMHLPISRAIDVRAGDTMRFNKGKHAGVIVERITDMRGDLQEIWYSHSSFTRGPHMGSIVVADPYAPINAKSQTWRDDMWDGLSDNNLRDLYFTSVHHSWFYQGPRPTVARRTGITVLYEDQPIRFQIPPVVLGDHTMCQIRPLAETLGATVTWDQPTQTVIIQRRAREARCSVGSEVGVIGGLGYLLVEPPTLVSNHLVVPLRFVAEALGASVHWDEPQGRISLTN